MIHRPPSVGAMELFMLNSSYYLLEISLDYYLSKMSPVRFRYILAASSRSEAELAFNRLLCWFYPDDEDYQWFNEARVSTSQSAEMTKKCLRDISSEERMTLLQEPMVFDVQNMPAAVISA